MLLRIFWLEVWFGCLNVLEHQAFFVTAATSIKLVSLGSTA